MEFPTAEDFRYTPIRGKSLLRMAFLFMLPFAFSACSWNMRDEAPPLVEAESNREKIEVHDFVLGNGDTIVGELSKVRVEDGDTLSDVARRYGLGLEEVTSANPDIDPWDPSAGELAVLPTEFLLPDAPRRGIVVNLAAMRMFIYSGKKGGTQVSTFPLGIGREGRQSPTGGMYIARKAAHPVWYVPDSIRRDHAQRGDPLPAAVAPGPDNPLGDYALYLSKASYLIHGTNKPYAIGLRASNGCLRMYPENIKRVFQATPVKTPVLIVNQPYLIGQRNGETYLEAHKPHEELSPQRLKGELQRKLKALERRLGTPFDWGKIESIVAEERGIPVAITSGSPSLRQRIADAAELAPVHADQRPRVPEFRSGAWYVRVDESTDARSARRLAAMLNHQGPQIPARAVADPGGKYSVLAGPFTDASASKRILKRLKVDMELAGDIVQPRESNRYIADSR